MKAKNSLKEQNLLYL